MLPRGNKRQSGVASTATMTTGLDDVAQQTLGDGHMLMDVNRKVALSSVMAALTMEWPGKVNALIAPESGECKVIMANSRACACGARRGFVRHVGALSLPVGGLMRSD